MLERQIFASRAEYHVNALFCKKQINESDWGGGNPKLLFNNMKSRSVVQAVDISNV